MKTSQSKKFSQVSIPNILSIADLSLLAFFMSGNPEPLSNWIETAFRIPYFWMSPLQLVFCSLLFLHIETYP